MENFPLPRELRDRIYAFLLDGQEVENGLYRLPKDVSFEDSDIGSSEEECDLADQLQQRSWSLATTYKFHTNILAVNKTIGREARQVLHEGNNHFILIEHNWHNLPVTIHEYDVPVVLDTGANTQPLPTSVTFGFYFVGMDEPTKRFVILWRDWPNFQNMLQWISFLLDVVPDVSAEAASTAAATGQRAETSSFISFSMVDDTPTTHRQSQFCKDYMESLGKLSIPGLHVKVSFDMSIVSQDRNMMDLSQQSLKAMRQQDPTVQESARRIVNTLRYWKRHADSILRSGQITDASNRYSRLVNPGSLYGCWRYLDRNVEILEDRNLTGQGNPSYPELAEAMDTMLLLTLDMVVTYACFCLRTFEFDRPKELMIAVQRRVASAAHHAIINLDPVTRRTCDTILAHPCVYIVHLYRALFAETEGLYYNYSAPGQPDRERVKLERVISTLHTLILTNPKDAGAKQDLAYLEKILHDERMLADFISRRLEAKDIVRNLSMSTTPYSTWSTLEPE